MEFNNKNSFKGYELEHISAKDIADEMEKFVRALPPGSPHLRCIRISSSFPKDFKLTFGQTNCLQTTLDLIVEKLKLLPEVNSSNQTIPLPGRVRHVQTERIIHEVDLLNIQQIWNSKLSQMLLKENLIHDNFPIIRSITVAFPYKFFIKCPKCHKELLLTITRDEKRGLISQPHFRFYVFKSHVIKCAKK